MYKDAEADEEEDDNEDHELPEWLVEKSYFMQQFYVICYAFGMMTCGAVLVMIFSDPVVKCFDSLGRLLNIDGF